MRSTISQNEQMVKRNHQKWTSINGKLDFAQNHLKKSFDMQNEIYKLK